MRQQSEIGTMAVICLIALASVVAIIHLGTGARCGRLDEVRAETEIVYGSSETCFTCHDDAHPGWSLDAQAQTIVDPLTQPYLPTVDDSHDSPVQMTLSRQNGASTFENMLLAEVNTERPRYIMQSEAGYIVLHGQWNTAESRWMETHADDWLNNCTACHTTGYDSDNHTFVEVGAACESCHGPAKEHVDTVLKSFLPASGTIQTEGTPVHLERQMP